MHCLLQNHDVSSEVMYAHFDSSSILLPRHMAHVTFERNKLYMNLKTLKKSRITRLPNANANIKTPKTPIAADDCLLSCLLTYLFLTFDTAEVSIFVSSISLAMISS